MAILIGKSRPGVNIIICGTSAGAAAHRAASAAAWKSTKAAGERWSGEPFVLPARIRRHVGRGNRRGSGGRVSIRRGTGGADDALLPQHLGRHLVCQQVRSPASPEGFQSQRQVGDKWLKLQFRPQTAAFREWNTQGRGERWPEV